MKSFHLIIGLFLFFILPACSKKLSLPTETNLSRDQLIEKYNYNWISQFSEGKALVYQDESCFVINQNGDKLFDYPYLGYRLDFLDDFAIIKDGFYNGVIDNNGKVVIPPEYISIRRSCPELNKALTCLLYTSPSPRDLSTSRMPSSA